MILFPNAKINIGLNILEKRTDGYHNLETVFFPIPWNDILEIHESEELSFKSTGIKIEGPIENNLCMKAFEMLKKDYSIGNVRIHLHKNIPMGAGLGGGSADGSFTLLGLNELFNLGISTEKLLDYAEKLGSDCPFFILNKPCLGREKGQILEEIPLNLSGYYLGLVYPSIHISTKQAFAGIIPQKPEKPLAERILLQIETWENNIKNDFEKNLFIEFPELKNIKDALIRHGAVYTAMSGSGSTLFGIFKSPPKLKEIFPNYSCFETILEL